MAIWVYLVIINLWFLENQLEGTEFIPRDGVCEFPNTLCNVPPCLPLLNFGATSDIPGKSGRYPLPTLPGNALQTLIIAFNTAY